MLLDLLIIFILIVIICFIISVFIMEDEPAIAIPFITVGMVFSILCSYGMWSVESFYVGYNASSGNTESALYNTMSYGDPYSYIFVLMFFIFFVLFIKTGFNWWREALKTQGELDLRKKG